MRDGMAEDREALHIQESSRSFVIPDAAQRRSGRRRQDAIAERRRRSQGRAPWMARVIHFAFECPSKNKMDPGKDSPCMASSPVAGTTEIARSHSVRYPTHKVRTS